MGGIVRGARVLERKRRPILASRERVQSNRKLSVPAYEVRAYADGLDNHLDVVEALLDFFPQHTKLHFREPIPHAPMDAVTKRNVLTCVRTVDDQRIGVFEDGFSRLPDTYHMTTSSPLPEASRLRCISLPDRFSASEPTRQSVGGKLFSRMTTRLLPPGTGS